MGKWSNGRFQPPGHCPPACLFVCPIENILVVLSLSAAKPFFVFVAVVFRPNALPPTNQMDGPLSKTGAAKRSILRFPSFTAAAP